MMIEPQRRSIVEERMSQWRDILIQSRRGDIPFVCINVLPTGDVSILYPVDDGPDGEFRKAGELALKLAYEVQKKNAFRMDDTSERR